MCALKLIAHHFIPEKVYRQISNWRKQAPSIKRFNLSRLTPVSRVFGIERGLPIDRYYIEAFLQVNNADIRGRVLEIGDPEYTRKFGGNRVTHSDVLHAKAGNSKAVLVGDLATGQGIPFETYDCIILTQTLLCIFEVSFAVQHVYSALKPGGVVLGTVLGIGQISRYDMDRWGDYWRFTDASVRKLFVPVFGAENTIVETYGNVVTACAYLQGLVTKDLRKKQLDYHDHDYQLVITFRAVKNES